MIPGDLLSAFPHRQFHKLPGLLDSRAALPNSYPNALRAMQGGSLYHLYDGLWYDPAERRTHDLWWFITKQRGNQKWPLNDYPSFKNSINHYISSRTVSTTMYLPCRRQLDWWGFVYSAFADQWIKGIWTRFSFSTVYFVQIFKHIIVNFVGDFSLK